MTMAVSRMVGRLARNDARLVLRDRMLVMLLSMASRCTSPFSRLVIAGTAVMIFVYAFINVAMVSGLVPVVGVPLPLVSYGGTSMLTVLMAVGLSMCAYVHRGQAMPRRIGALV